MEKNLYIDASHPNETRVVLKSGESIEDYEYEGLKNNLIKNNIYLGKVSRVEPSLQAAFIDFGRDRHGFLSFNDNQSDYYQIPQSDLAKIKEEEERAREELLKESELEEQKNIKHHMYGVINLNKKFSTGQWLNMAIKKIKEIKKRKKIPILVGGTGLYFQSLIDGLVKIPEIPIKFRNKIRLIQKKEGQKKFYEIKFDY